MHYIGDLDRADVLYHLFDAAKDTRKFLENKHTYHSRTLVDWLESHVDTKKSVSDVSITRILGKNIYVTFVGEHVDTRMYDYSNGNNLSLRVLHSLRMNIKGEENENINRRN